MQGSVQCPAERDHANGAGDAAPVVFAAMQNGPYAIAFDDTNVYWTLDTGSIMKLAKNAPATPPTPIVTAQSTPPASPSTTRTYTG